MRYALVIVTVLSIVDVRPATSQQATFRGGTRTVAVYGTVTELGGRLVPNLQRGDFQVTDNGKPQELTIFANDLQPITVVLMLDRSVSMRRNFELVEEAAEKFVQELGPGDQARIGSFSNRIQVDPRTFTSDRDELLGILRNELQEEGPTPLWNAINVAITALLHQDGRRVILVFTDGMDDPFNPGPNSSTLKDVMKRAEEEDVMVYAIGLAGSGPAVFVDPRGRGRSPFGPGGRGQTRRFGIGKPDPGLAKLATETGGGYFELTDTHDLGATFKRVAEELHHQYVLGFTPAALDGKTHRIDVRVKDPALTVRARKSYLAAGER